MRKACTSALVLLLLCFCGGVVVAQERVTLDVTTAFAPFDASPETTPIAAQWRNAIRGAQQSIRVTLYSFTLLAFRDALRQAKQDNPDLDIRGVFDEDILEQPGPAENVRLLACAGIPLKVYRSTSLMHHKFVLIDADDEMLAPQLITGSANMTVAGVRFNHENQSLFQFVEGSRARFDAFRDQFEAMWNNLFIYPPGSSFDDYVPAFCE